MTTAWFDCCGGASGDMILGALFDAGLDPTAWDAGMAGLGLAGWQLALEPAVRAGLGATRARVSAAEAGQPERRLGDLLAILDGAGLPARARQRAARVFERLAEAEGRVHRMPPGDVHFHEVGALDALVDVIGAALGLELLGVDRVLVSPLPLGRGWTDAAHGRLPLPAPATLELLRGWPVVPAPDEGETVTPTGAAILTALGEPVTGVPALTVERIGYGAGARERVVPNVVRVVLGREPGDPLADRVVVLETAIDDMNPQLYPALLADLLGLGALDAYVTPLIMKHGRPGAEVTVLAPPGCEEACAEHLLLHTTTLGVRRTEAARRLLERRPVDLETPYGPLLGKAALRDGKVLRVIPEYEDCARLARERGVPILDVHRAAAAAGERLLAIMTLRESAPPGA